MLAFLSTSDKFADFISSAAKGESHQDLDAYEVLNLQLEQWRRRFVGVQPITLIRQQIQRPNTRPPSWMMLLALRAEAVRTLLLRPFFFPKTNEEVSQRNIQPALELVSDLTCIISSLDERTNLYCVQGPFYHHVLHSAAALFYLILTYADGKGPAFRAAVSAHAETITSVFQTTLNLSEKYVVNSRASRRLFRRFKDLGATLERLGIGPSLAGKTADTYSSRLTADLPSITRDSRYSATGDDSFTHPEVLQQVPDVQHMLWQSQLESSFPASDINADTFIDMGCAETLLFDWTMADQELMFGLSEVSHGV